VRPVVHVRPRAGASAGRVFAGNGPSSCTGRWAALPRVVGAGCAVAADATFRVIFAVCKEPI
jgi:hypothetical protein